MSSYKTVLAGIDFSPLTQTVLESATRFVELSSARRLHLVHATQPWSWPAPLALHDALAESWEALLNLSQEELEALKVPATRAEVTRETRGGPAARELVRAATESSAQLIVAAIADVPRWKRVFDGSVTESLIRAAHCPVLVAGEERRFVRPQRIVAAIDLSPVAREVLRHASELAALSGAELTIVSAYDFERALALPKEAGVRARFDELARDYRRAVEERVHAELGDGRPRRLQVVVADPPSRAILETIEREQAQLVVVGTSGENAWHRMMLGSTASGIISDAPCPVFVVPYSPA